MGEDYDLTIELISPNGIETLNNTMITGNLTVIGIVAQNATKGTKGHEGETAETLMYKEAINYIDRWNSAEEELASLLHLTITRPLPTVVTIGGVIDVTYLLDTPHEFEWKGVYVDADLSAVETVRSEESGVQNERQKTFMELSALQGSILESIIFEDDFQVESISTAKLFQLVNSQPAAEILTIDSANIDTILPTLEIADNIKEDITNAVNQGLVVKIPEAEITYEDWTGIGYIKENPETGESGWMLSGMLASTSPDLSGVAGAMTVITPENWVDQVVMNILSKPYTGEPNDDPLAATRLIKMPLSEKYGTVGKELGSSLKVYVLDRQGRSVKGAQVTFRVIAGGGRIVETQPVQTDANGIAETRLILGEKTNPNPYYMQKSPDYIPANPDDYLTQIGVNIISATVSSSLGDIPINQPFEAYALPDVPQEIIPLFGNGTETIVNGPAGDLVAKVVDQYGNPISNIVLTFTAFPASSRNASVPLPANYRNIEFYKKEECSNPYPIYGDCSTYIYPSAEVKTKYFGGTISAVLGNTVNTAYTVQASAPDYPELVAVQFTLYSKGYKAGTESYVNPALVIGHLETYNDRGELVNASRAGTQLSAPLIAKLTEVYEEIATEGPKQCSVNNRPVTCWRIIPTGIMKTEKITNGTVTFNPSKGGGSAGATENLQNGQYRTWYTTGAIPALNTVDAWGEADIPVRDVRYDPDTDTYISLTGIPNIRTVKLKSGQHVIFDKDTGQAHTGMCSINRATGQLQCAYDTGDYKKVYYTVYGVDIQLNIEPDIVLLNEDGYTSADTTFRYTILPVEYSSIAADIDLYEKGENNQDSWVGSLAGDSAGSEGTAVAVAGSHFDINTVYTAEAVLNRGSDAEIRSGRAPLPVMNIRVMNDAGEEDIKEIKYGEGARAEKRYYMDIPYMTGITCAELQGKSKIRVYNSRDPNLATIAPPDRDTYYMTEYPLEFTDNGNGCLIKLNDNSTNERKFIITNLTRKALKLRAQQKDLPTDLSNIMPMYGGTGNRIEIEINGATKQIPIEPVGVIVIGIDGLRQDVLYNPTEASYTDTKGCGNQSCYIDIRSLPGLLQIMTNNGTVKLKDVTAIFPSITFASWASIFTGKLPKETGITGNEFFARDLTISVPERFDKPAGIISFGSGAFKGYDEISPLASDFFIPYQANWAEPVSTEGTPQNNKTMLPAETVFEAISGMPEVKERIIAKGGDPVVVANSHYARGAYWLTWDIELGCTLFWTCESETIDQASWDKFDDYLGGKYLKGLISKERNDVPFSALTVWYLPGLDHEAHFKGMGVYRDYFMKTTDEYIREVVDRLKKLGEFDNKIFIITADHGHTAMPTDLPQIPDEEGNMYDADTSCKLKLDDFDKDDRKYPELANNNLHIWELGEVFTLFPSPTPGVELKVLAPKEIAEILDGATSEIKEANVIAALNGPMAHIYIKGTDWKSDPDERIMGMVLNRLYKILKEGANATGSFREKIDKHFSRLLSSIDVILVRKTLTGEYELLDSISEDSQGNKVINTVPLSFGDSTEYIRAIDRIKKLNNKDRSGDIILIMNDKTSGNAIDRYTTGTACKSWHGSLNPSDSYVPLIVAYPGGNKYELEPIINNTEGCSVDQGCDGNWRTTEIIKEIIETQYSGQ